MFYKQITDKLKKEADKRKLTKSNMCTWLIIVLLAYIYALWELF